MGEAQEMPMLLACEQVEDVVQPYKNKLAFVSEAFHASGWLSGRHFHVYAVLL
jgi:hypothetical protein